MQLNEKDTLFLLLKKLPLLQNWFLLHTQIRFTVAEFTVPGFLYRVTGIQSRAGLWQRASGKGLGAEGQK